MALAQRSTDPMSASEPIDELLTQAEDLLRGADRERDLAQLLRTSDQVRRMFGERLLLETKRELGQFLTPEPIAALAAAGCIDESTKAAIDPACGDGSMLWAARARAGTARRLTDVVGIEILPMLARIAALPRADWDPTHGPGVTTITGDAFLTTAGFALAGHELRGQFDAVLGNPPYVRYQAVAPLLKRLSGSAVQAFTELFPGETPARLVDRMVRTCLLAHLLQPRPVTIRQLAAQSRYLLTAPANSITSDLADQCWIRLIRGYSGVSDLSVPMWFLTWLLARPSGRVAYVTTRSSQSREYGRTLRYFMLRFLQPLLIIEQEGNHWFGGAQVTTSLVILRARSRAEAAPSLSERGMAPDHVAVRVRRDWDISDQRTLVAIARDLMGTEPVSLSAAADVVLRGMLERTPHPAWRTELIGDRDSITQLLDEERSAQRSGSRSTPVLEMEAHPRTPISVPGSRPNVILPKQLRRFAGDGRFLSLADLGITVNQGLRTGCNEFFYVSRVGPVTEVQHGPADARDHVPVATSELLAGASYILPARYLRPVVRYQRSLKAWTISASDLKDLALITGHDSRPDDARTRTERLGVLPPCVTELLDAGENATHVRGDRRIRVPDLSAVRSNESHSPAAAKRWWYSISIRPRHEGSVFMPRVITGRARAFLNDPSQPALIDANFSTFVASERVNDFVLLALLNSTWVAALLELIGTPMGGGALKVEASHLRRLPVPELSDDVVARLDKCGREFARLQFGEEADVLREIDASLASSLAADSSAALVASALDRLRLEGAAERRRARS